MSFQKITSTEHALQVLGLTIDFSKWPDAYRAMGVPEKDIKAKIFNYELWLITEANNKLNNWKGDYNNPKQRKWSIWAPDVRPNAERPSGLGLVFGDTLSWFTRTVVGARLEVGTSGEAEYIFKDFIEKWDYVWLIQE